MAGITPLIAGNWKMNGLRASLAEIGALRDGVAQAGLSGTADILVCPPATLISAAAEAVRGSAIAVGAQDCHAKASGAFTGDLSAPMLADAGASAVILGHSERRSQHCERDRDVNAKAKAAHAAGLKAIVCVGETAGERQLGLTLQVIGRQLRGSLPEGMTAADTVIAYEPVWAIGTGLTPTSADIAEVHAFIRGELGKIAGAAVAVETRILYGGSVKPDNAAAILTIAGVNGGLVGGASLLARDFLAIIKAASKDA
ncbi:MAG: triose-phosphate isomerase [Rhodomicrobiaceae bacterium]